MKLVERTIKAWSENPDDYVDMIYIFREDALRLIERHILLGGSYVET
ncbi:hypothetical protein [Romboutsia sp.]|nr:hypothetical protein [Romboutsia sp.]HSQ90179.1 hypothetical protein [Romboutsia sp.]